MPNWTGAELAVKAVRILTRDSQGRILTAEVPGTSGRYRTRLVRQGGVIWCRCDRDDGKQCLGNQETVCYHCLATILAGIDQAGIQVEWFDSEDVPPGQLVRVRSAQSNKTLFGVVRRGQKGPEGGASCDLQ